MQIGEYWLATIAHPSMRRIPVLSGVAGIARDRPYRKARPCCSDEAAEVKRSPAELKNLC